MCYEYTSNATLQNFIILVLHNIKYCLLNGQQFQTRLLFPTLRQSAVFENDNHGKQGWPSF